jgi:hypothetical protein
VCDCPACSGEEFDPHELIDDLVGSAAELASVPDPLEAELAGATLLAIGQRAGEQFEQALLAGFIPQFEARADAGAVVMLLAVGAIADGKAAEAAMAAADRLAAAGVPVPRWADELREPVTVGGCLSLRDAEQTASVLSGTFHRAGRSHAFVLMVNHLHCGAADGLLLVPHEAVPAALDTLLANLRTGGVKLTEKALDPAEFRWRVECALEARAVHDADSFGPDPDEASILDENGPGYPVVATLLRNRLTALPVLDRPKPPHDEGGRSAQAALRSLLRLGGADLAEPLRAKRARDDGPAPVYQLRVALRGTKPPIWRRLEVPADINLADLHQLIQVAFNWHDLHLHVFETPYGEFGTEDSELGHHPEASVTLEQVAPRTKSKLRYTYDFGDDWQHDILVEKVLDRDPAVIYPRCTGGRRAAPPEDSGGVWGYAELVESGAMPDPAAFNAATVTRRLVGRR